MPTDYLTKNKVFTEVVRKDAFHARIQTITHTIVGEIYFRPDQRVKDQLGELDQFVAVTAAKVYKFNGELAFESTFITLNRDHIVWFALEDQD